MLAAPCGSILAARPVIALGAPGRVAGGRLTMNVAIFTDNDFNKVNGVTTTLRAVLEHAPPDIEPRIYTCEDRTIDRPDYLALKAFGVGIPYYGEMKMYAPPLRRFLRRATTDKIDLVHLTTPGPVGLAAMYVAARLGIRDRGEFSHRSRGVHARSERLDPAWHADAGIHALALREMRADPRAL